MITIYGCFASLSGLAVSELVRCTAGAWMVRPPA
jgi:hypothetical protein